MAINTHLSGGENEQPIGDAKKAVKLYVWNAVKTSEDWEATTTADKLEIIRLFVKYGMLKWFN